jgi:hypothetical protein
VPPQSLRPSKSPGHGGSRRVRLPHCILSRRPVTLIPPGLLASLDSPRTASRACAVASIACSTCAQLVCRTSAYRRIWPTGPWIVPKQAGCCDVTFCDFSSPPARTPMSVSGPATEFRRRTRLVRSAINYGHRRNARASLFRANWRHPVAHPTSSTETPRVVMGGLSRLSGSVIESSATPLWGDVRCGPFQAYPPPT